MERLLDLDRLIDALAGAFRDLSTAKASVPARVRATTPSGRMSAMIGYLPSAGLGGKLVGVFPGNADVGLPTHRAVVFLFDDTYGNLKAVMDGTYITAVRTAGSAALSVRLLARTDARILAIVGAGVQGDAHLRLVPRQRAFSDIRVVSRTPTHAKALAARHPHARAVPSIEEAVTGADVVCCCTDTRVPLLQRRWLADGVHLTSVGTNPEGQELDRETLEGGRLFVESRVAFEPAPAGSPGLQGMDAAAASELGEVLLGILPGRTSETEITIYKSMGHAVEDLVAARLAYDTALAAGSGTTASI